MNNGDRQMELPKECIYADEIIDIFKGYDCGDSSCVFASNKKGMRTNGVCRCNPNKMGVKQLMDAYMKLKKITIASMKERNK